MPAMDDALMEVLMKFLENVIYNPEEAELDLSIFPEENKRLGLALEFLAQCSRESRSFGKEVLTGNLDVDPPNVENGLAAPLKEIQGALRHLRWQTREIAKGDYTQRIDFMGDLGESFNTMTLQLKERQDKLIAERKAIEQQNKDLDSMQNMITNLALDASRFIVIIDELDNSTAFRTKTANAFASKNPVLMQELEERLVNCPTAVRAHPVTWELNLLIGGDASRNRLHFTITSNEIRWQGRQAIAHMITDDTVEIVERESMVELAYNDALTNLHNRRYAMRLINELRNEKRPFVISFIDIDYLKYCNDEFGHEEGDEYLIALALLLNRIPTPRSVCRIGGDEFMIVKEGATASEMEAILERLREDFLEEEVPEGYLFRRSFSYGVVEIDVDEPESTGDLLKLADSRMYDYKTTHKKFLMRNYQHDLK